MKMVFTITNARTEDKNFDKGSVWKEILLSFIASIPFFTHGIETANLTSTAHSGHFLNFSDVPWSATALMIGAGVSAPVFCYVIDRYGRKIGLFVVSMVQGASLIPLFLENHTNALILHILAGLAAGGLFTIIPIYIREISTHHGFCTSLLMVMTSAGYMMRMVMSLEVRMYVMVALVGVQFLSILVLVESPCYLVMRKKIEIAKSNLSKLKRLSEDSPQISTAVSILRDESDRATAHGTLSVRTVWRNKIWLDATKIGVLLYTVTILCGSILFLDQHKTLVQLKIGEDPENMLVLYSILAGCVFCVLTIVFFDRKYVLTFGYIIMTLSSGVLAVYTQSDLTVTSSRWLPIVALVALVFGYGVSWGLPTVIMVEILNMEIRATLVGAIYAYSQILKLIHVHTFSYIERYIGDYTLFYIFAGVNLFGTVYTLFEVPNIKNRSVRQIERELKRPPMPA